MPSIGVKLYSVFFKFMLKHRLQSRLQALETDAVGGGGSFGVTSRPDEETAAAPNPSFTDVSHQDIHIDAVTSLSVRVFLPDTCLNLPETRSKSRNGGVLVKRAQNVDNSYRRNSYGGSIDDANLKFENGTYRGGYRLAPENKYPAAFEDGLKVLHWLAKQANLAECSKSLGGTRGGVDLRRSEANLHVADAFGASMVEPWLAAHGDPSRVSCILSLYFGDPKKDLSELLSNVILQGSRCVLLGVSCGGNIADYVARKAVEAGKLLDPVKVVAQVLMYPFFIGSIPTHSEIKMANSYFYDKAMCILAWKLFLSTEEFSLDHPAANPLVPGREGPPLKRMPPTLTVVAEHDSMRDRAIAYSEELRKVNVDAPVLEYKDAVHEFATLDMLLKTPQAQACAEDIAIWVKKYISLRGHEFSY
ncbi:UNVERIFIED_CONTAM: putative carboxylesterase 11 [Sesamum angustifolium]|uniref:Carboxylesterase 11 n=1 Tax=Sesamum angustifolium TaxID=2727405 RepID=A0AAW2RNX6_9LAMI